MKLIPQQNDSACWYASAQMLVQWKRRRMRMTLADHPDPSETAQTVRWEVAHGGLINANVLRMAGLLGLKSIPPMSPSLDMILDLLRRYGPLWTNGQSHIVTIAGADKASGRVLVYDPWPPRRGAVQWRSYPGWYIGLDAQAADEATRDTGPDIQAVFLYHP